jgi:hypothetical protein
LGPRVLGRGAEAFVVGLPGLVHDDRTPAAVDGRRSGGRRSRILAPPHWTATTRSRSRSRRNPSRSSRSAAGASRRPHSAGPEHPRSNNM